MKFTYSLIAVTLAATTASSPALAEFASCPQHFVAGQPPQLVNAKLKSRTQELCYEAFAVLHSGQSRTPLYAAERLTRQSLEKARELSRKDSFQAEDRLPERDRAELSDYARSGYDRGHLAPNANMPTRKAQSESFSLANMVPQVHENNAGVWAGLEAAARQLARDEGELYVISGPVFSGNEVKSIGRGVLVPTQLWKVIYSPKQQRAGAYLIDNDKTQDYQVISIAELQKLAGINPLPALPAQARDKAMELPKPQANRGGGGSQKNEPPAQQPQEDSILSGLLRLLLELLKGIMGR